MSSFVAPSHTGPHGSYVVAGPVRHGAMGDILRASFVPGKDTDEISRLLAELDRPAPRL